MVAGDIGARKPLCIPKVEATTKEMRWTLLLIVALMSAICWAGDRSDRLRFNLRTGVPGQDVRITGNLWDWDERGEPMRETLPGEYSVEILTPFLPELQYKFLVDGRWMHDPANPRQYPDGHGGQNSVIVIESFQEDPWILPEPGLPRLETHTLELTDLEGAARQVLVLAPHGKISSSVTVYFQDGLDYLERTGVESLLARLNADPSMPRLVGVFIPPKDRMREYKMLDAYVGFVAERVVSEVEKRFNTGGSPRKRVLIGPSLGGLITLYTALQRSDVFGYAASQSGSCWWNNGAILKTMDRQAAVAIKRGLKLFLEIGLYEGQQMLDGNRAAAERARKLALPIWYQEHPSTHDWLAWRNRLQPILRHFLESEAR